MQAHHGDGPALEVDRGAERHAAADATMVPIQSEPVPARVEGDQERVAHRHGRDHGIAVQAPGIAEAGIVGDLASESETELHELDPERVARTEAFGEVARRVPIAGAGHAEVHLGEQGDGSAGTAQKCRGRGAVLAPLDIPGRDPQRGRGRPDRDRLSDLDLMQGRD